MLRNYGKYDPKSLVSRNNTKEIQDPSTVPVALHEYRKEARASAAAAAAAVALTSLNASFFTIAKSSAPEPLAEQAYSRPSHQELSTSLLKVL
ncbi:hypothetical protein FS837_000479 [Tulasnella sp. UAMH 9824]|nr:hypothetical protein FS837_000479 [Tulasnella sp. UAMH 9824]